MSKIFLYGTLRYKPLFDVIAGEGPGVSAVARLPDHAVDRVAGTPLPMLLARKGAGAIGDLWSDLSASQIARLDAYELPFGYLRAPVTVIMQDGQSIDAESYFPPATLITSGEPFDLDDWVHADGRATMVAAREIADHEPPLDGEALRRQWGMIRMRAEGADRAARLENPCTRRYAAQQGDVCLSTSRIGGDFFKYQRLDVRHRRFDGKMTEPLIREVFQGAEAALVLPYDPLSDRILLVEQFRCGPAVRGDANPWTLEPVAGIVDAGETPEQAARRETLEEAGLDVIELQPMFDFYASPGSSTDYFYCFLGLARLNGDQARFGGNAHEAEDLRLHVLDFDEAMRLAQSGEINVGPLLSMLYWLAHHRARLRRIDDPLA